QPELSRATVSNRPQRLSSCSRPARNSSGWLAALAVHAVRRGRPRQARGWLLAALLLALVYVGLELHESGRRADLGLDIEH
ncbi:cytochrome c oxidase subunit 3 family protein, partial [Pseudomonas aeruginosa]